MLWGHTQQLQRGNVNLGQPGASQGNQAFQEADQMGLMQQYAGDPPYLAHSQSQVGTPTHPSPLLPPWWDLPLGQATVKVSLGLFRVHPDDRVPTESCKPFDEWFGARAAQLTTTVPDPDAVGLHPSRSPALDQLLAAVQLQIQQTQQVTAQMEQHRRAQEALAGQLDQQMVFQRLMGDILAPTTS